MEVPGDFFGTDAEHESRPFLSRVSARMTFVFVVTSEHKTIIRRQIGRLGIHGRCVTSSAFSGFHESVEVVTTYATRRISEFHAEAPWGS